MLLKFLISALDDGTILQDLSFPLEPTEEFVERTRHTINSIRQRLPHASLVCDLTLYESSSVPLNTPQTQRLIELFENAQIQIVTVIIMHASLLTELEERNELYAFLKTFQTHVTLFSLVQAPNDFVLAWWFDRVFGDTTFLPALTGLKLNDHTYLDSAIVMRLIEAFSQTTKASLQHVFFTPKMLTHMNAPEYMATLLQRAYENVVFTRSAMTRSIGQYAFNVLAQMVPFHQLVVRLARNPYEDEDDVTMSFIFDQRLLTNGGVSLSNMTLQQYFGVRWQFSPTMCLARLRDAA